MHILIATPAFPPFTGGGERHTGTLARQLIDRGHTVTVFTSTALREPDFWQGRGREIEVETAEQNLTIVKAPIKPFPGGLRGLLVWRKSMVMLSALPGTLALLLHMARSVPPLQRVTEALAAVQAPFDVFHGFNISWEHAMMAAWQFAQQQKRPFVASPLAHLGTGTRDPVARNSTMRHQRHMLSTADLLITNTALEAQGLQRSGIDQVKVKVAGPGVDIPETISSLPERGASCKPYVLFVGRTSYDKGAMHAVEAVLRLRQKGRHIQLVLIGLETAQFRRFYDRLPAADQQAIHFLGFLPEERKHAYLKEAEALLLPSRSDSFGIVLLESWLHGRPVIAAAAGGIPAVVDHRQNGILVPFGDVAALAGAIDEITKNETLSRDLGQNGRHKLLAHHTWEVVTESVLAAYHEVVQCHQSAAASS